MMPVRNGWLFCGLLVLACSEPPATSAPRLEALFPQAAPGIFAGPGFRASPLGIVPALPPRATEPRAAGLRPALTLPPAAGAPFRLAPGQHRAAVEVLELGLVGEALLEGGAVVYERAQGRSYWSVTSDGYEEWIEHLDAGEGPVAEWEVRGATPKELGDEVVLEDTAGLGVLRVTAPSAWSADGRPGRAWLRVSGTRLALHTDLRGHVLVDPLWSVPINYPVRITRPTVTMLLDGRLLAAGGSPGSGETDAVAIYDPATGLWRSGGSTPAVGQLNVGRYLHTATLLKTGKVLVTGGVGGGSVLNNAELFDPVTETWTLLASTMASPRSNHTATLLPDGRVLLVGGADTGPALTSTERFDPGSQTFASAASMTTPRMDHRAVRLQDGTVLAIGGRAPQLTPTVRTECERYNPTTNQWATTGALTVARDNFSATGLAGGDVLVAGGQNGSTYLQSAERYNPGSGQWTATGAMASLRASHTATLLPSGLVLVAGGSSAAGTNLQSAELYNPTSGTWSTGGSMVQRHTFASAGLLPNGRVLVVGGVADAGVISNGTELYDAAHDGGTLSATGALGTARLDGASVLLPSGQVLVVGGANSAGTALRTAELYTPGTGTWAATGSMQTARRSFAATLLSSGQVLVAGGIDGTTTHSSAELYDPTSGTWTTVGSMTAPRREFTLTTRLDGSAVAIGGAGGTVMQLSVEAYSPMTRSWNPVTTMASAQRGHTATLRPDGSVVAIGGFSTASGNTLTAAVGSVSPSGQWTVLGSLPAARAQHAAVLLPNGKVLVVGGATGALSPTSQSLVHDPASGMTQASSTVSGSVANMPQLRAEASALLLRNGKVLAVGGRDGSGYAPDTLLYDPMTGRFEPGPALGAPRGRPPVAMLPGGRALVAGGPSDAGLTTTSDLYDDGRNPAANMTPTITAAPASIGPDGGLTLTGTRFEGVSEGGRGAVDSFASNYPLVLLRGLETDRRYTLTPATWSSTSLFLNMPAEVPTGLYWLSVVVNGAPSGERLLEYFTPLSLTASPASSPPRGMVTLTGAGGSGTYAFDFATNLSGGSIVGGTYTAGSTGSVTDVVRVTDEQGRTATRNISVTAGVGITPASATVAPRQSRSFTATGGSGTGFTWAMVTSNSGGTINATSGAYAAGATGNVNDVIRVTDSLGNTTTATITVTAGASITPGSATVPPRGSQAFSASGGSGTGFTWSLATNASGGSINATSGQYTAGAAGGVGDEVRVTDSLGNFAQVSVTVTAGVTINPNSASLPPLGSQTFSASGGSGTGYAWALTTNASGATINPSTGLYTAGGTEGIDTVRVTDSLGNTATANITVTGSLAVNPPAPSLPPRATQALSAIGGSGTGFVWELLTNNSGATITPGSGTGATYTAGPTGGTTDTVRVTDSLGNRATATITVTAGVSVTPPMLSLPPKGAQDFIASGGSGVGYVFALTTNNSGATVSGARYAAGSVGNVTDVLTVTDSLGNTATVSITVTAAISIAPASPSAPPNGMISFTASGGSGNGYVWSVVQAPSGGSIDRDTGAYRAGLAGGVTDVVRVVDLLGNEATASISVGGVLTITPASPSISPRGSVAFTAAGGSAQGYAWVLSTNASQGQIDGATGAYTAGPVGGVVDIVRVTDSVGNSAQTNVTVSAALTLMPPTAITPPRGSLTFMAGGGAPPYTFALTTNSSGGSIDATTGAYTAGATPGPDVVTLTDSLNETRTAQVTVTAGVTVAPPSATRSPGEGLTFVASGGSGMGFTWAFETNGSQASLDPMTGEYVAGPIGDVDDVVRATDSLGNTATATVRVLPAGTTAPRTPFTQLPPVSGWSCGCGAGAQDLGALPLLALGLLAWRRRRARVLAVVLCAGLAGPAIAAPKKPAKKATPTKVKAAPPTKPVAPPAEPLPAPEPAPEAARPLPPADATPSLVVLDAEVSPADGQVDPAAVTEIVTASVSGSQQFKVLSSREMASMLGLERQKALLGCSDDASCMAEIANALGSDLVLTTSVARTGGAWVVSAKLIDGKRSAVAGRATLQAENANAVLAAAWQATQQALDAWGTALPAPQAERWAGRPKQSPPAEVTARSEVPNFFGITALAVAGLQPLSDPGNRGSIGAEVDLTFRRGRFDLFAGVIIGRFIGARLGAGFALIDSRFRLGLGLRGTAYPELMLFGGGLGLNAEFALNRIFAITAVGAGEVYPTPQTTPQPPVVALLGALGVSARF